MFLRYLGASLLALLLWAAPCGAFAPARAATPLRMTMSRGVSRRAALGAAIAVGSGAFASAACAKEADEALDREALLAEINSEVESGGIFKIGQLIEAKDWEGVKELTKGYDKTFRKKLMGDARKTLRGEKDAALMYRNGVTFDLIAINKAARKEDQAAAREGLAQLQGDVSDFLKLFASN